MKTITRNLVLFALLLLAYTLLFRFGLSSLLDAERFIWVWPLAIIYAGAIFATAWSLGSRDGKDNFLFDAGLRWNLTTWIVWGASSEAWFLLDLHSRYESVRTLHLTLIIWFVFIILHVILFLILRRKRTIDGIYKEDIFE